jgi:FkbM family methyltransferase
LKSLLQSIVFDYITTVVRVIGRKRWLRFGIRDRLARLVEHPDASRGVAFVQSFYSGIYTGKTSNFIDWSARYFGAYAEAELDLFCQLCPSPTPWVVLDVGANVGHHTLFYALKGPHVISVEPNPAAICALEEKLAANRIDKSVLLLREGLSDSEAQLELSIPDNSNLGMASLNFKVGCTSINVSVAPGDSIPVIQRLTRLDFIKVDVEGHEMEALLGLKQTISLHRPPVFFEWNSQHSFSQILPIFPGYSFWVFSADKPLAVFSIGLSFLCNH